MIRKEMFFGKPEKIHEFMETRGKKYGWTIVSMRKNWLWTVLSGFVLDFQFETAWDIEMEVAEKVSPPDYSSEAQYQYLEEMKDLYEKES
jgi:hypothetical protein